MKITSLILLLPALLFFLLFTGWPIFEVVRMSLYKTNFIASTFVGLDNYKALFSNEMFLQSMKNSIFYVILLTFGHLFMSVTVALAVFKLNKRWQDITRILVYIPVLAAGIIIAQVWRWIFSANGVANWLLSLVGIDKVNWFGQSATAIPVVVFVVVVSSFGTFVIIILANLLSIDKSIIEAAMIDGASERQIKWKILLPMIFPTLSLVALLAMINALQIFETIYALVPQQYAYTPTFCIYTMGFKLSQWGMASAESVLLLCVVVVLSLLKRKVEHEV